MATWRISNYYKKEAVESQFWSNGDLIVIKSEGYRWGTWECESNERPDIDLANPRGYEIFSSELDWELVDMDDGCWMEWSWDDGMSSEERNTVESLWEEDWYEGLESAGWYNYETEHWIYGPIRLVNVDTGEEFIGVTEEGKQDAEK
jgi:hypothetical protein